jgi:hypothetical protein
MGYKMYQFMSYDCVENILSFDKYLLGYAYI